jgi:hypothetical protein
MEDRRVGTMIGCEISVLQIHLCTCWKINVTASISPHREVCNPTEPLSHLNSASAVFIFSWPKAHPCLIQTTVLLNDVLVTVNACAPTPPAMWAGIVELHVDVTWLYSTWML